MKYRKFNEMLLNTYKAKLLSINNIISSIYTTSKWILSNITYNTINYHTWENLEWKQLADLINIKPFTKSVVAVHLANHSIQISLLASVLSPQKFPSYSIVTLLIIERVFKSSYS